MKKTPCISPAVTVTVIGALLVTTPALSIALAVSVWVTGGWGDPFDGIRAAAVAADQGRPVVEGHRGNARRAADAGREVEGSRQGDAGVVGRSG